jgi:hypothetical protein
VRRGRRNNIRSEINKKILTGCNLFAKILTFGVLFVLSFIEFLKYLPHRALVNHPYGLRHEEYGTKREER